MKKIVFDIDLFEELKKDVGASFGIKKLIRKINITACPTDIGEALINIQNHIDQVCTEYHREVDAKEKLQSTEQAQAIEFDNALRTSKASKDLAASIKSAQAEFNTCTASKQLWESHIAELQKKISDAKVKQAAIQGLDSTEADNVAKQSVDHIEKATAMNEDIACLKGVQAVVQYKISLAKIKYDGMKATIHFWFSLAFVLFDFYLFVIRLRQSHLVKI